MNRNNTASRARELACEGFNNVEIAAMLKRSPDTIRRYTKLRTQARYDWTEAEKMRKSGTLMAEIARITGIQYQTVRAHFLREKKEFPRQYTPKIKIIFSGVYSEPKVAGKNRSTQKGFVSYMRDNPYYFRCIWPKLSPEQAWNEMNDGY